MLICEEEKTESAQEDVEQIYRDFADLCTAEGNDAEAQEWMEKILQ